MLLEEIVKIATQQSLTHLTRLPQGVDHCFRLSHFSSIRGPGLHLYVLLRRFS
jgi:hypothetical protein